MGHLRCSFGNRIRNVWRYAKTAASPETSFVSDKLIQKTEAGYLITSENAESTLVPKLFVAGNCAQKYTKAMAQNLVETVINDF